MFRIRLIAVIAWALALFGALGGNVSAREEAGFILSSDRQELNATVEAVDYETREVSLRFPKGARTTITAGPNVQQLESVSAGDTLRYVYSINISVVVVPAPGPVPEDYVASELNRYDDSVPPALHSELVKVTTALVEDINRGASTIRLKWSNGTVEDYTAKDPENLKKVSIGDHIVVTKSEHTSLQVEKP